MKKLCIFDMDGTLVNTIDTISHFANTALNKFGYEEKCIVRIVERGARVYLM